MADSKDLWLSIRQPPPTRPLTFGWATGQAYLSDPRMIAFIAARYKFVGKMLSGSPSALEIGCGDAFGAPMVAQAVQTLICTDIDEQTLADNRQRLAVFPNITFAYHDFRAESYPKVADTAYLVDVIEHIFPEEEEPFLRNIARSLLPYGACLIGTPNQTAERYASVHSRAGHVNLKTHETLSSACLKVFHRIFLFSMNDELVHTGYHPMAHYIWALCVAPR